MWAPRGRRPQLDLKSAHTSAAYWHASFSLFTSFHHHPSLHTFDFPFPTSHFTSLTPSVLLFLCIYTSIMPQPQPHQHHLFDLNVPLPMARRKYHAHLCQSRLHQLGYHGIAFCHTAFGRLKPERDDADKVLPWNDWLQL